MRDKCFQFVESLSGDDIHRLSRRVSQQLPALGNVCTEPMKSVCGL